MIALKIEYIDKNKTKHEFKYKTIKDFLLDMENNDCMTISNSSITVNSYEKVKGTFFENKKHTKKMILGQLYQHCKLIAL